MSDNIVRASGMGFREKAALLKLWKSRPKSDKPVFFGDFFSATQYDTSRDELILPDGSRVSIANANNPPAQEPVKREPKNHTPTQHRALQNLERKGEASSWDFASGTVAWLRKHGYVKLKAESPPSVLVITEEGRLACFRGET